MAEAVAIGVEASDKMPVGIAHYHIRTSTSWSKHGGFYMLYPLPANLTGRTGIIKNLAWMLELPLLS